MTPISNHVALTGRVRTYIEHPEKGTMPVSCTVYVYDNNLFNILKYLSVGLRGGAGINVILDKFKATPPQNKQFYFYLPESYPDINDLTDQQRTRLVSVLDFGKADSDDNANIISVNDSMEESDESGLHVSIQDSWNDFIYLLLSSDRPVYLDLSLIRPKGRTNAVGLTSSGAVSFLSIYEAILHHINTGDLLSFMQLCGQVNEVLRRGGCVTADTWVETKEGARQVKDLIGVQFEAKVNGLFYESTSEGFFDAGVKEVYELTTTGKHTIKATGNHEILSLRDGKNEWVALNKLTEGDTILLNNHRHDPRWEGYGSFELGWLLGNVLGDGTVSSRPNTNRNDACEIGFWEEHAEAQKNRAIEYLTKEGLNSRNKLSGSESKTENGVTKWRIRSTELAAKARELNIYPQHKVITEEVEKCSSDFYIGFLQAFFDADGTVRNAQNHKQSRCIVLAQTNLSVLQATQRMLGRLGIVSNIYTNSKTYDGDVNGYEYRQNGVHSQLVISQDNMEVFRQVIGFSNPDKAKKLEETLESYVRGITSCQFQAKVKSIVPVGELQVYDCTIDEAHEFDANGIRISNSYKNGIITFSYIYTGQYIINYLNYQLKDLPGSAKKSIRIDERVLENRRLMKLIEVRVNDKSLMLEKVTYRLHDNLLDEDVTSIGKNIQHYYNLGERYKLLEELYSNVCLAGNTMVITRNKADKQIVHRPIRDLVGEIVEIWDGNQWLEVDNFTLTGKDKIVHRVKLYDGRTIDATAYHTFILEDGTRLPLNELKVGQRLKDHGLDDLYPGKRSEVHEGCNEIMSIEAFGIGYVYCCNVPTTNSFALSNGIQTGNCKEIQIQHTGTCLLAHVNLGQIETFDQIPGAFTEATNLTIDLWKRWKQEVGGRGSQYLSPEKDRQIGIGVIGFANLLARFGIKYTEFVTELENCLENRFYTVSLKAWELAHYLNLAYVESAQLGRLADLLRIFTMAPTQSCAYTHVDLDGNTTVKNINPPLARRVRRTSHTVETLAGWYYHGDNVETMEEVINTGGTETVQKLWELWQRMMNRTGLAHSMSFDLYWKIDQTWLENFILHSPLVTTYYQFYDKLNQDYLNKSRANIACAIDNPEGCVSCSE